LDDIGEEDEIVLKLDRYCKYRTDVVYYRHFYAHKDELFALANGLGRANRSFSAAKEIIGRILSKNICPTVIVPVEQGIDMYGRQVVRFLKEQQLLTFESQLLSENELEVGFVYLTDLAKIQATEIDLGRHYLSFPAGCLYNGFYAPKLYLLEDILTDAGLKKAVEKTL